VKLKSVNIDTVIRILHWQWQLENNASSDGPITSLCLCMQQS